MNYTITELLWLLLVYSFLGWLIETVVGTIKNRSFINRGFSTGPFCLVYGIAAVLMTLTTGDLLDNTFFLFIGCGQRSVGCTGLVLYAVWEPTLAYGVPSDTKAFLSDPGMDIGDYRLSGHSPFSGGGPSHQKRNPRGRPCKT